MRRITVATISVAASLALAACAERDTTSPRRISPNEASRTVVTSWPVCDETFKTIKDAGTAFFANRDVGNSLISDMQKAYKQGGGATAATPKGLDVLARVAAARFTSGQKAGSDGGPLVTAVIACTDLRNTTPTNFDPSAALARGIFEIRGTDANAPAAFAYNAARDETAPIDPYQGSAVPLWGIEGTWPTTTGQTGIDRYIVYGYPLAAGSDVRDTDFELGRLPTTVDVNGLAVAVCSSAVAPGQTQVNLLVHNSTDILLAHNASFCIGHLTANATSTHSLMQRLVRLVTPKDAFAQDSRDEFIGGLPSGWSPFHVGHFANTNSALSFSLQPGNNNVNTLDTVKVTVIGTTAPVVVTLTIAGNNGDPTTLEVPDGAGGWTAKPFLTAVSNADGVATSSVATFIYAYSKAGGYTLNAAGSLGGTSVAAQSALSNLFQIKNK
jgi:hypothetical protein